MARADHYALDPSHFNIPPMSAVTAETAAEAEVQMSLAVMEYAREAYGMRFEPHSISLWLDHIPEVPEASDLLPRVAFAADPGKKLRALHPSHPTFEALRMAYLVATGMRAAEPPELPPRIPDGPRLRVGDHHPQVAMVRERLDVPPDGVAATYFDRELGNEIRNYLRSNRRARRREINDDLRALLNASQPPAKLHDVRLIEANMLRWRWMPRDLGDVYVWNNIPEFTTRLLKNGALIHEERIIVGQTEQQTPIFSDKMEKIVFKPQWGVPNSIKITDLLPKLRSGDTDVLDRRGMKIIKNGRTISPERIRWSRTDIRYLSIVQGPSPSNPLGEMKFMFPNQHSVYMHDTTSRSLFRSRERTFSHGCIRVRNPRKLAEVIFEDVQGWDVKRIPNLLGRRAEENNEVYLDKPIMVHNVYFTLLPDRSGGFRRLKDFYGHDRRIIEALEGKSLRWIADNDPARIHKRRVEEIERSTRYNRASYSRSAREAARKRSYSTYRSSLGAAPWPSFLDLFAD
jgi:murein L,D-transpeptidase YcbB/YkuD